MNWVVVFVVLTILLFVVLLVPFITEKITENRFDSLRKKIELIREILPSVPISKISYPIYYINMDKHTDRRTHMENQLEKFSDNFHRIRGFNGYEIQNKKTDTVDGITFVNSYEPLSKAEIGCTMSHLIAIKTARDSGTDTALICEDDVLFDTYALFGKSLEEIVRNAPKDWEILQLVAIHPKLEHWYSDIEDISDLRYIRREYPGKAFWSCAVYLINKNGMDKVSRVITDKYLLSPISKDFPKEGVADAFIFDLANTYAVLPCPFIVNNIELESTIHPDHTPLHIHTSLILLSKFDSKLTALSS